MDWDFCATLAAIETIDLVVKHSLRYAVHKKKQKSDVKQIHPLHVIVRVRYDVYHSIGQHTISHSTFYTRQPKLDSIWRS